MWMWCASVFMSLRYIYPRFAEHHSTTKRLLGSLLARCCTTSLYINIGWQGLLQSTSNLIRVFLGSNPQLRVRGTVVRGFNLTTSSISKKIGRRPQFEIGTLGPLGRWDPGPLRLMYVLGFFLLVGAGTFGRRGCHHDGHVGKELLPSSQLGFQPHHHQSAWISASSSSL